MKSFVRGENSILVIDGRGIGMVAEIGVPRETTPCPWSASPLRLAHKISFSYAGLASIEIRLPVLACTRDGHDVHNVRGRGDKRPLTFVGSSEVC